MRILILNTCAMLLGAATAAAPAAVSAAPESARLAYTRVLAQERVLQERGDDATLAQIRSVIGSYERMAHRFPASGYSDNALWQAANLALTAYERFGHTADRQRGLRLLAWMTEQFPSSSLVKSAPELARRFEAVAAAAAAPPPPPPAALPAPTTGDAPPPVSTEPAPASPALLREITRTPLPNGVRVTIELDAESSYVAERLEGPRRVFFDFRNVRTVPALQDATLTFDDDVLKEIRLGRHPHATTRVVFDMEGLEGYSVFSLYNPFRLVVDFTRPAVPAPAPASTVEPPPAPAPPVAAPLREVPARVSAPAAATANSTGTFSLARQLGLGVSRIVIDAGHGGHDPGARANGVTEAELVLDVSKRLARLLEKLPGTEVVMTRDTDVFVPLEERTAIANRVGADLFLSIHANAARNTLARGVETYFLNFALNAEAEAVAARENAGSTKTMGSLPEIVKAIATNNKIDESRDFARMVQRSMARQLTRRNRLLKDLGVKQAPFVVLIGAMMPSVLAEISFVTNKAEAQLLKSATYRQAIAQALFDAIVSYQRSLKKPHAVATR